MCRKILDIITNNCASERLDHIVMQNKEYLSTTEQSDKALNRLCEILTAEQQLLLDNYIVDNTKASAIHTQLAYKQGLKDCYNLICDLKS